MDRLRRSDFLHELSGKVFLSHHDAMAALMDETRTPLPRYLAPA